MNERPTEFLEAAEVRRLLATPDRRTHQGRRDAAVLRILAEAGLREGELCSLLVESLKPVQGRDSLHFESLKKRSRPSLLARGAAHRRRRRRDPSLLGRRVPDDNSSTRAACVQDAGTARPVRKGSAHSKGG